MGHVKMPVLAIGGIGMPELIVVLVIVMLVFGASRLPQLGESVGKAVRNLKRGLSTDDDIDVSASGSGSESSESTDTKQVSERSSAGSPASSEVSDAEVVERKS